LTKIDRRNYTDIVQCNILREIEMDQDYLTKFSDMAKKVQEPFKALAELNVKTLQGLAYLRPDELAAIKKPDEFVEKQLDLALQNGHKALEFMQKSYEIILSCAKDVESKTKGDK
jgi:hypothetical protein